MTDRDLTFSAPGKGSWVSLRDHFPNAVTAEYGRLLSTAMEAGEAVPMATYGLPVRSIVVGLVHGHVFISPSPLVGRRGASLPPTPVLWLACRVVPAFRQRARAARSAVRDRPWLAEAAGWWAERDGWLARLRELESVDMTELDDAGLADHLLVVRQLADDGYRRHFELHGCDLFPTGLLLTRARDWGLEPDAVVPVLAGSSPASLAAAPELDALRVAVAGRLGPHATLADVDRVAPDELRAFLAEHGSRLVTGYDLDSATLRELPELVTHLATGRSEPRRADDHEAVLERLAARVDPADRPELERLVADARATCGVRDDNGSVVAAWPVGLLRRAMQDAGRRLVARGALDDPAHGIEATVDELDTLLRGRPGPTAGEVSARAILRRRRSSLVVPPSLGDQVDLPVDALPREMALMSRALLSLQEIGSSPQDREPLTGEGIGDGVHRGRAIVATDPADAIVQLDPGDVLVVAGTTPAYNVVFTIAGAVVCEEGGLVSHAAVIAREMGLPAVIGAAGCMEHIPHGALVEVDAAAGRVRVLAPA